MKMNEDRKAFALAGLLAACALAAPWGAGAAKIRVPANYPTIQAAVTAAAPGDIILVSAGTYSEPQIVIDKPLVVLGAGADVTIIDGGSASLSAEGLVRITAGGNVVLSGFTLQNAGASGHVTVGLFASSPVAGNRYMITDNKIIGSGDPNNDHDYGVYAYGGLENFVFEENVVTGTGANAVLIELHAGPTDISDNTLDVGVYGADAIFTMTYNGLDITTVQRRNNNVINVGTGGPFDADHRATGITFASAYRNPPYVLGTTSGDLGDGKFTSVQIMRNTLYNVEVERRGISLWNGDIDSNPRGGDIVSPQVVGNEIKGVGGTGSVGIQLLGLVSDAKLINNHLADLDVGIHLRNWFGFAPRDTKVIANRFRDVGTPVSIDPGTEGTKEHEHYQLAVDTKQHADRLIAP